jgi:K+-transporting ATPase KdpF subunit
MSLLYLLCLIVGVLVCIYLLVALLKPELF